MSEPNQYFYEFGPFRIDVTKRLLFRGGEIVPLKPKTFETLLVLVEQSGKHGGKVLNKEELMKQLWPDSFVEESNLTFNISSLRKALGESLHQHQYIVTVPGRGYSFVAGIKELTDESAEVVVQERTRARITIEEEEDTDAQEQISALAAPHRASRFRLPVLAACALLIGLVAIAGYYFWSKRPEPPAPTVPSTPIKSIAVLPFKPLVASSRDEALELGMADTLITRVSNLKGIIVRPVSAVRKYRGLEQDAVAAGQELKVDSVLDGSIQHVGEWIRVTVRLVSVADGKTLWAEQFDEKFRDIFTIQDSISEKVAGALALKLSGEERELLAKHYTKSTDAYQDYLMGRYFWNQRTSQGLKKAIEYFQQAVRKDANYALAYAAMAGVYAGLPFYTEVSPHEAYPKARAAALEALKIDPTLAEAHTSLAAVMNNYDWDWQRAEEEYRRAIELNPNYATAHQWYSGYLMAVGRLDESIAELKKAQQLDPLSLIVNTALGRTLYQAGRKEEAVEQLHRTLNLDPNFGWAHMNLGEIYEMEGRYEEAISEFQKYGILEGDKPEAVAKFGEDFRAAYAAAGEQGYWRKKLDWLTQFRVQKHVPAYDFAFCHALLGEKEAAFAWLEKAYQEKHPELLLIKTDSRLDSLRPDPRFADLLRRMNLAT